MRRREHVQHERYGYQYRKYAYKGIDKSFDKSDEGILFLFMYHLVLSIYRLTFLRFFLSQSTCRGVKTMEHGIYRLPCNLKHLGRIERNVNTFCSLPHIINVLVGLYSVRSFAMQK